MLLLLRCLQLRTPHSSLHDGLPDSDASSLAIFLSQEEPSYVSFRFAASFEESPNAGLHFDDQGDAINTFGYLFLH